MSCSSKYEKLVEYIKTQREVYGNIMGFVDSLESEETVSNFTMPDINLDIPDSVVDFSSGYAGGPVHLSGGMGEDHISFTGISTANEEVFTVPSPLDELTGLNITTEKDDK